MKKKPSVTVVVPYKDKLNYLFRALNSIFHQSYKNYNITIIYDDKSRHDLEKIEEFIKIKKIEKNLSIKIEINKKNLGAGLSRNIAIRKSNSKYIAFLDADDLWAKNKLETQINFMEKNGLVFSHTSYYIIDKLEKIISHRKAKKIITFNNLLRSCDIGLSTVIINTKFLKINNLYFPSMKTKEDFVLWLKIVKKINYIIGINKKLTYYRKSKKTLSSNKFIGLINGYKVYRVFLKYNQLKSIFFLILLSINFLKKNYNN